MSNLFRKYTKDTYIDNEFDRLYNKFNMNNKKSENEIKKIIDEIEINNSTFDERGKRLGLKKKLSSVSILKKSDYNQMLGHKVDGYVSIPASEKQPLEVNTTDVSNFFKLSDRKSKDIFRNIQKSNDNELESLSNLINKEDIQTTPSNLYILKSTINDIIIQRKIINKWRNLVNQSNQSNANINDSSSKVDSLLRNLAQINKGNSKVDSLLRNLAQRNQSKEFFLVGGQSSSFTIDRNRGVPGQFNINIPKGDALNYNNQVWNSDISSDTISQHITSEGSSYVMTRTRNQGICGSCWSWSLITACEIAWFLAGGEKELLSPQTILDCEYNHLNGGSAFWQNIDRYNPRKAIGAWDIDPYKLIERGVNYNPVQDFLNQSNRWRGYSVAHAVMGLLHHDPDGGIASEKDYPYIEEDKWNDSEVFKHTGNYRDHPVHTCKTGNLNSTSIKPTCFINSVEYCKNGESDSSVYELLQKYGHVCASINASGEYFQKYGGGIIDVFKEARSNSNNWEEYQNILTLNSNHAVTIVGCGEVTQGYYNEGNREDIHEE